MHTNSNTIIWRNVILYSNERFRLKRPIQMKNWKSFLKVKHKFGKDANSEFIGPYQVYFVLT